MPCQSEHMNPNAREIEASKVQCCIDELNGDPIHPRCQEGYHPDIYCKTFDLNKLTAHLCGRLGNLHDEIVLTCSLELQMWWRDHQEADKKREEHEQYKLNCDYARQQALAKLTPEDKIALGIKEN